jgi:hypothetical protein
MCNVLAPEVLYILLSLYFSFHQHFQKSQDSYYKEIFKCMFCFQIVASEELISLSLSGLDYYQNYYQRLLLTCITLAFLGWIAWLLHTLIGDANSHKNYSSVLDAQHPEVLQENKLLTITHSRLFRGSFWMNISFLFLVILTVGLIYSK